MNEAKLTWTIWQSLLNAFAWAFTRPGHHRFAEWITAMALNVEEHTITQSVLALEQPAAWKALESFAEYGAWHADRVTAALTRLIEKAPGRIWYGYHVSAVNDTKVHRSSEFVWDTCTFHEYAARCPNRATTVRAHHDWVVLGAVLSEPEKPGWFLSISGRLYFRKSQMPAGLADSLAFRTKCELAVALLREQARIIPGKHLGVFDGGYALRNVVRPLVRPEDGSPRIEFLTRYLTAMPDSSPCPQPGARGEAGAQSRSGARDWSRPVAAACGRRNGRSGPPSSTAGGGRSAGRRWCACGTCWDTRCRSRRSSPVSRAQKRFTLVTSAVELAGVADGGVVRSEVPSRRRLPRPEAAAGVREECRACNQNPQ